MKNRITGRHSHAENKTEQSSARNHSMEDTRFLGSDMFASLVFYLWQSLPHLISSATSEVSIRKTIHIQCWQLHQWPACSCSVAQTLGSFFFFSLLPIFPLRSVLLDNRRHRRTYSPAGTTLDTGLAGPRDDVKTHETQGDHSAPVEPGVSRSQADCRQSRGDFAPSF